MRAKDLNDRHLKWYIRGFTLLGVDFQDYKDRHIFFKIYPKFVVFIISHQIVCMCLAWKHHVEAKAWADVALSTTLTVLVSNSLYKNFVGNLHKQNLINIFQVLDKQCIKAKQHRVKAENSIIYAYYYFANSTLVLWIAYPLSTLDQHMIYPAWHALDITLIHNYLLEYWVQCFISVFVASATVVADTFLLFAVAKVCSEIKVLILHLNRIGKRFSNKTSKPVDVNFNQRLRYGENESEALMKDVEITTDSDNAVSEFMKHYHYLKRVMSDVAVCHSKLFFTQVLCSICHTCFLAFAVLGAEDKGKVLSSVIPLLATSYLQLFMYCWFGEKLTQQCADLHRAAYDNSWYVCSKPLKSSLNIMMEYFKKPVILTGGSVFEASLRTFVLGLRESISYIIILRTLTQKN